MVDLGLTGDVESAATTAATPFTLVEEKLKFSALASSPGRSSRGVRSERGLVRILFAFWSERRCDGAPEDRARG
jgi:hypothetical protein